MTTDPYLLGHDDREWDRLREQHALWGPVLLDDLAALGLETGQRVCEVGCGAGDLLADLAAAVGPTGHTTGLEQDPAAAARAAAQAPDATVHTGDLHDGVPDGPHDFVLARWVLSFLPDPRAALAAMAAATRPGGLVVVHDYVHDGVRLYPRTPSFDAVIAAYREAYRRSGGDLWVAGDVPAHLTALGLSDVQVRPHVMTGPPGSPVHRWVERFVHEHLGTVLDAGLLTTDQAETFQADWARVAAVPGARLISPLQLTVSGRMPD